MLLQQGIKRPRNVAVTRKETPEGKPAEMLFFETTDAPVEKVPETPTKAESSKNGGDGGETLGAGA